MKQMTNVEKIIINSMFADGFNAEKHFLLLAKRRTHILLKIIIPRIENDLNVENGFIQSLPGKYYWHNRIIQDRNQHKGCNTVS